MNKAIFWDLQGTLGGDAVASIEAFEPYPFAKEALQMAKAHGYCNIVITNQSRIGKGLMTMEAYRREAARIAALFDGLLDDFLCCPHQESDGCDCKKPKPGLVWQSAEKHALDVAACWVVGDMGKNEVVLAHNAGCKAALVLTGGGQASLGAFRHTWAGHEAELVAENALEAVKRIVNE